MFNNIVLVGNLTRDIELIYTNGGTAIAKTAIATTRKFTSNGEKKEEVCFIDITFFGRSAEVANQYLQKGSKILVNGRLNFEQWQDQQGQKRSKHNVIVEVMQMLDSKPQNEQHQNMPDRYAQPQQQQTQYQPPANGQSSYAQATQTNPPQNGGQQRQTQQLPTIDIDEDEIPF